MHWRRKGCRSSRPQRRSDAGWEPRTNRSPPEGGNRSLSLAFLALAPWPASERAPGRPALQTILTVALDVDDSVQKQDSEREMEMHQTSLRKRPPEFAVSESLDGAPWPYTLCAHPPPARRRSPWT